MLYLWNQIIIVELKSFSDCCFECLYWSRQGNLSEHQPRQCPPLCFSIFFAIICTRVHHFNGSCKAPYSPLMGLKSLFIYLEDSVPEMDPTLNAEVFSSSLHLCDFATFFLHSHLPVQRRAPSIRLHFQNLTCRTSLYIQSQYFPVIIFSRTGPQGDCWIFSPTSHTL